MNDSQAELFKDMAGNSQVDTSQADNSPAEPPQFKRSEDSQDKETINRSSNVPDPTVVQPKATPGSLAKSLSTFAVVNIAVFYFLSHFFLSEGFLLYEGGAVAGFIYSTILLLLSSLAVFFLGREFFKDEENSSLPIPLALRSSAIALLSLLLFKGYLSLIRGVELSLVITLAEQATLATFFFAWWYSIRNGLVELYHARLGFSAFASPTYVSEREYKLHEGEYARDTLLISKGIALVHERSLGGDSVPLLRQKGDYLLAGSMILKGSLAGTKTANGDESSLYWFSERLNRQIADQSDGVASEGAQVNLIGLALIGGLVISILLSATMLSGEIISLSSLSFTSVHSKWLLAALALFPLFEIVSFLAVVLSGTLTDLFYKGASIFHPSILESFNNLKAVFFTVESADLTNPNRTELSDLHQVRVKRFEVLDPQIDKNRLLAVVFGLLRNDRTPLGDAVREFSYQSSKEMDLFPVDEQGVTAEGLYYATIHGTTFLLGNEGSLIEQGVHLEVSETLSGGDENCERLYISIEKEIVASFVVESLLLGEMPKVVSNLRRNGIRPYLVSSSVEQAELDVIGKRAGFELPDIRGVGGPGAPENAHALNVLFRARAGEQYQKHPPEKTLTWYRPSLLDLSEVGVLLTGRRISLIPEIIERTRMERVVRMSLVGLTTLVSLGLFLGVIFWNFSLILVVSSSLLVPLSALILLNYINTSPRASE